MRGDHRSRFCEHCQLRVHNVSAMSRTEVQNLVAHAGPSGRVCINGFTRPDGELIAQEDLLELLEQRGLPPERSAAIRATLAAGMIAAALSLAACTVGQRTGGSVAVNEPCPAEPSPPTIYRTGGMVYMPRETATESGVPVPPDAPRYPTTPP